MLNHYTEEHNIFPYTGFGFWSPDFRGSQCMLLIVCECIVIQIGHIHRAERSPDFRGSQFMLLIVCGWIAMEKQIRSYSSDYHKGGKPFGGVQGQSPLVGLRRQIFLNLNLSYFEANNGLNILKIFHCFSSLFSLP